jgi:hypothetical protein
LICLACPGEHRPAVRKAHAELPPRRVQRVDSAHEPGMTKNVPVATGTCPAWTGCGAVTRLVSWRPSWTSETSSEVPSATRSDATTMTERAMTSPPRTTGVRRGVHRGATVGPSWSSWKLWRSAPGPRWTAVLGDTRSVFHRAGVPQDKDRYSITFSWTSRWPLKPFPIDPFSAAHADAIRQGLSAQQRAALPRAIR